MKNTLSSKHKWWVAAAIPAIIIANTAVANNKAKESVPRETKKQQSN
jgi:hypothetical protein